jgi:outer membrane protein OmpA-like peptidoglycan-associated protein
MISSGKAIMLDRANQIRILGTTVILMILAACATQPDPLAGVRARVAAADANDAFRTYAAGPLAEARRTLALAAEADEEDRGHLVYMTERNLDIADAVVARQQAEHALATLGREQATDRNAPPPRASSQERIERRQIDRAPPQQAELAPRQSPNADGSMPPMPSTGPTARSTASAGGAVMTIPDVSFDSGIASLNPGTKRRLDGLVSSLQQDPTLRVMIEGHSDNVGRHEANLEMSLSRAKAVKSYLAEQGIEAERLQTLGQGAKYPIASNESEEGRWRNRRVEIAVYRTAPEPDQNAQLPTAR